MKEFGGAPLQTTQEQDKDFRRLNNLRTNFAHFTPKGWSIESVGLPRIVLNGLMDIIERPLTLESRRSNTIKSNVRFILKADVQM